MGGIVIKNVSATFGESDKAVHALGPVDLTVEAGEFVSLVGPSGAGKTTLLRILSGGCMPASGHVSCGDRSGRGRAVVFQEDRLLPWRSVLDNVAFALEIRGVNKRTRHAEAERCLELVGIADFKQRYPHELSGGMRQRANLARAFAIEPDVLLMDEPFAALDHQTREIMQFELLAIWERTRPTVLFVTHQIDEAVYLSDRLIVLSGRPGKIKADLPVELPRPRDLAIKREPDFHALVDHVWSLLEGDLHHQAMSLSKGRDGRSSAMNDLQSDPAAEPP